MQQTKLELFTPHTISFSTEGGKRTVTGRVALYYDKAVAGSAYNPEKNVEFRIARGAFDHALKNPQGIAALMFHDWNRPVGIYGENLSFETDHLGLIAKLDLPNTIEGNNAWEQFGANGGPRLIKGMSFTSNRGYDKWTKEGDTDVLTFYRWADLQEVTFTNRPAFKGTSISWSDEASKFAARERKFEIAAQYLKEINKK